MKLTTTQILIILDCLERDKTQATIKDDIIDQFQKRLFEKTGRKFNTFTPGPSIDKNKKLNILDRIDNIEIELKEIDQIIELQENNALAFIYTAINELRKEFKVET